MTYEITRQTFDEVMMPVYNPFDKLIIKGKGSYLYDSDNNMYVDFTAGIAVNSLGHKNKKVIKIIKKQSKKLIHVSNVFTNKQTLKLGKSLTMLTDFNKVFFVNSGTEANEAALKLARRYAFDNFGKDKTEIISFNKSFHGRTFFSVCVGGQSKYSDGFGPKVSCITHLDFNDIKTFEKTISNKTCAVILEPIQGEGGIIKAHNSFLEKVRELCNKYNALLICDEVQTGIGRTAKLFAYEHTNIVPDIVTLAKGLAGGLPIGAVLTHDNIAKHFTLSSHGSTFGGSPLSCAVGNFVINKVAKDDFLNKVKERQDLFLDILNSIAKESNKIADIRVYGLLIGINLKEEYKDKVSLFVKKCAENGLLLLTAGNNTIRLTPSLNIKKKTIIEGLNIFKEILLEL